MSSRSRLIFSNSLPWKTTSLTGWTGCAGGDLGLAVVDGSLVNCCLTCDCHHGLGDEPGCVPSWSRDGSCQGERGSTTREAAS